MGLLASYAPNVPQPAVATVLGAGDLAVTLPLKVLAEGHVSGVYTRPQRLLKPAHQIRVGTSAGCIECIGLRAMNTRTEDGEQIAVINTTNMPRVSKRPEQRPTEQLPI